MQLIPRSKQVIAKHVSSATVSASVVAPTRTSGSDEGGHPSYTRVKHVYVCWLFPLPSTNPFGALSRYQQISRGYQIKLSTFNLVMFRIKYTFCPQYKISTLSPVSLIPVSRQCLDLVLLLLFGAPRQSALARFISRLDLCDIKRRLRFQIRLVTILKAKVLRNNVYVCESNI